MTHAPPRLINTVLIANRGEIALRIVRTAHSLGMTTVVVHSDADTHHPATRAADIAVRLPGNTPTQTYLHVQAIIDAALRTGADAVHPGYGFLSERADAAQAVMDAGLIWMGPPPAAIAAMGSKIASKQLMRAAGVPVLPDAVLDGVDLADPLAVRAAAATVGVPLLVKASAGGGGRGMRRVDHLDDAADAVAAAMSEAAGAFGDGTVFLERYVTDGRHVEIQIMADRHDTVVSLHERDCSVQRRHQKIIEEAPSPAVDAELRARMGAAAVAAARAVNYEGAGTVEFLLDEHGDFAFLEMNTRLQVEHPVTEAVTGLDLVALQFAVAEGQPLPAAATHPPLQGHAIEARLYAEDPAQGYRPSTGEVAVFHIPDLPGIRVDTGVDSGTQVSAFYDPMLAKVIAHGPDRASAIRLLRRALAESVVVGVTTNRTQLIQVLDHDEFQAGHATTAFLERHDCRGVVDHDDDRTRWALAAVALADQAETRASTPTLGGVPSGWRNHASEPQQRRYQRIDTEVDHVVHYRLDRSGAVVHLWVDGFELADTELVSVTNTQVRWRHGGITTAWSVTRAQGWRQVHGGGLAPLVVTALPRLPEPMAGVMAGSLTAPMPGAVLRVLVDVGTVVSAGQSVVVMEAMKMEHAIHSPHAGVVTEVLVTAGQQVDNGQVLVVVDDTLDTSP
jgi:acetyl/propionyl-CoA carboxylase alpha subunit